jgi:thioredoxin 2
METFRLLKLQLAMALLAAAPAFAQAAQQLAGQAQLAKLDTEAYPQAAAPLGIRSIPTMVVFKEGRELARISGALPASEIVRWVRSVI